MILTKLSVADFGVFRGSHNIDLSPKSRRPIILFGEKNGAGKSTVLEALRVCLYGIGALGAVSKDEYLKFLERKIHRNPAALIQPNFASIQDRISIQSPRRFGLLCCHALVGATPEQQSFRIPCDPANGQPLTDVESEHWQDFLRELIPPGISQLSFLMGKKFSNWRRIRLTNRRWTRPP